MWNLTLISLKAFPPVPSNPGQMPQFLVCSVDAMRDFILIFRGKHNIEFLIYIPIPTNLIYAYTAYLQSMLQWIHFPHTLTWTKPNALYWKRLNYLNSSTTNIKKQVSFQKLYFILVLDPISLYMESESVCGKKLVWISSNSSSR